jgi:hypothetical protein
MRGRDFGSPRFMAMEGEEHAKTLICRHIWECPVAGMLLKSEVDKVFGYIWFNRHAVVGIMTCFRN